MASSSLSQEDVDHDLEVQCSRRSRIRTARAVTRTAAPLAVRDLSAPDCELGSLALECDHDASPKPRAKDKRCPRPNHANKCKAQRERRKLREKRRSTGVVHLQSTESTGGSTGEEEELLNMSAETRRNTTLNEVLHQQQDGPSISSSAVPPGGGGGTTMAGTGAFQESRPFGRPCKCRNNKSPSDLDADDEDNQEYDSAVTQSDGGNLSSQGSAQPPLLPSSSIVRGVADWEDTTGDNRESLHRALGEAERVQEEVRRLVQLLKEKELRIHSLERRVLTLAKELNEVTAENRELREMNSALLDGVPLAMQPPAKE